LYQIFNQHLHDTPPSLSARLPYLPPAIEDAVFGALAKDPRCRFPSVQDFATVLSEAFLATQPLSQSKSVVRDTQEEIKRPLARVRLVPVPSSLEQDHANDTIPLPTKTARRTEEKHEKVASISSQPTTRSQTFSKQAKPSLAQTNRQRLLRRV